MTDRVAICPVCREPLLPWDVRCVVCGEPVRTVTAPEAEDRRLAS